MVEHERLARERAIRLVWVTIDRDLHAVAEEFRVNKAPSLPLRPTGSVAGLATPTVYRITPDRVEKFTGRFAVKAALAETR